MKPKKTAKSTTSVGKRVIKGLEEAVAWSSGDDVPVRVTYVQVPDPDIHKVRGVAKHPESVEDVLKNI